MKLEVSKLAQNEIENAREYYNLKQDNLGNIFKENIKNSVDSIIKSPRLYPKVTEELRRVVIHKFPYSIFYTLLDDIIMIISVAHQHRKPFYKI